MLHRFEAVDRPAADQPVLAWAFHDAIYQIQRALRQVVDNFPNPWLKILLTVTIFPLGLRERAPGDRLTHGVAQLLLAPSETRSRLTSGIYTSARSGNPIGLMEQALPQIIAAEPLERKMLKAIKSGQVDAITWDGQLQQVVAQGGLTATEASILQASRKLVQEIIAVDEFDSVDLRLGVQKPVAVNKKQHAA
jgi:acyl-CoA dehydrogenase